MKRQLTLGQQRIKDDKKVGIWIVYGYDTMPYPLFIADNKQQAQEYQGKVGYYTFLKFWKFGDEFGAE